MNPVKGLFFLSALALSVAVAFPAQAQGSKAKVSAKREAAIKKCLDQTMRTYNVDGFGAAAYRSCMAKEGQRP